MRFMNQLITLQSALDNMKLTDVVNRINGNVDRFTTDLKYYIGGEHFESNELLIQKKGLLKENLGQLGFKFHFAFQERDVIFMARNPHLRKAGMVMFSGLCSDASYILRSKDENVLTQEYLAIMLQSDHFWDYCESHKVGSVNFANNWTSIANYEFELPSLEKQKEFATKVWAAYEVKQSYLNMIDATNQMVKAKFVEMFGGEKERLEPYISIIRGVSYKPSDLRDSMDEGGVILRANNIVDNNLVLDDVVYVTPSKIKEEQYLKKGDILMCASSGSPEHVGKVALVKENMDGVAFGAFCMVIRPTGNLNSEYIFSTLASKDFRKHIEMMCSGTNILNVKQEYINNWTCAIPNVNQQQIFANIYSQAESSIARLNDSIAAIDRVILSLINQNL